MPVASAAISLGLLCYCKYADFFISGFNTLTGLSLPLLHVDLPIGISFYTFQILSYVIDVYRGDVTAQRNLIDLAAYVAMFPQLIAGPIVRYKDVNEQLVSRRETPTLFNSGVRLFVVGLAKKCCWPTSLACCGTPCPPTRWPPAPLGAWAGACAYTLQIYFDFAGYSDMARGLGRMLGFEFCINFNYPYISKSVTEFWRRWHISLSTWFRDYVYIPLGGQPVRQAPPVCQHSGGVGPDGLLARRGVELPVLGGSTTGCCCCWKSCCWGNISAGCRQCSSICMPWSL